MDQRRLLALGIIGIGAAFLIGAVGMAVTESGLSVTGWPGSSGGPAISMETAQQSVQSFLDREGNKDLRIDELMEFDQNFYALIKEQSTGTGAFELLVDKRTGAVAFEPGPNMMWNTKYSPMGRGGMMGGRSSGVGTPSGAMTVSSVRATQIAQGWLDSRPGGYSAGTADGFYGYYTFHFDSGGRIAGMLSVNGYGGQIWLHTWHGSFIRAKDFGA